MRQKIPGTFPLRSFGGAFRTLGDKSPTPLQQKCKADFRAFPPRKLQQSRFKSGAERREKFEVLGVWGSKTLTKSRTSGRRPDLCFCAFASHKQADSENQLQSTRLLWGRRWPTTRSTAMQLLANKPCQRCCGCWPTTQSIAGVGQRPSQRQCGC